MPEPGPYQSLCKTLACATCTGTDQKIIRHKLPWRQDYPGIVGHESIGRVIKTGPKVRHIEEGETVFRPTAVYNGDKLGDYYSLWGGFSEYGLTTDGQALQEDFPGKELHPYVQFQMKIPRNLPVSPSDATMIITLKEVAGFVMSLKVGLNTTLAILGTGAVAMAMCFFARLIGAYPVIVIGRRDEALARMRNFGADFLINNRQEKTTEKVKEYTRGKGVELVIDTAGDETLLAASAELLAETGRLAAYAIFETGDPARNLDQTKVIQGTTGEVPTHNYLLHLVRSNLIPLKEFYSHRMPLSEIAKGFEMLNNKEAFKIVFETGGA